MNAFFYRVQCGDSLISVCRKFSAPPEAVIRENNLSREIEEGDIIFIASAGKAAYIAGAGDSYDTIAKKCNIPAAKLKNLNGAEYVFYGLPLIVGHIAQ